MDNRQAGRRRNGGGQRPQGGGSPNRQDNGNRIDSRARGNAAQLLERYRNLARDSQMQGDRVNTEYYLQFADHYYRVLSETRSRFEESNGHHRQRDDIDDDNLSGTNALIGTADYRKERAPRESGQRNGGQREDGRRNGEPRDTKRENGNGDESHRARGSHETGDREPRDDGRYRLRPRADQDQPRGNGDRSEGNRLEVNRQQPPREPRAEPTREPDVTAELIVTPAEAPIVEAPRRRGRPRRQPVEEVASDVSAPESGGIKADRLPRSVGFGNDDTVEAVPVEKARRRRRVRGETVTVPSAE